MPRRPRVLALLFAALAVALVAALAGCGDSTTDRPEANATLMLDFQPNAVHAGIALARQRDFDGAEGVHLRVQTPSSSTDAVKLLVSGRATFAVLDIHDLALARAHGRDLVGVMALVQRPLASVLAQPDVRRPRQLAGRSVGVTGVPSDDAVLRAIVAGDGGDPRAVRKVTIGFQAVSALLAGRVSGATAFWNVEGVALKRRRPRAHVFRLDEFGAPPYPELVLTVTRRTLEQDRSVVRATIRALRRGYTEALADPESSLSALGDLGATNRPELQRQFDAVAPAFTVGVRQFGELNRPALERWAAWEAREGLVPRPPDVDRAFDFGF
jgi:ABC-type nitrate/sulfonate/bicarbonate transport system substrate-binding protein